MRSARLTAGLGCLLLAAGPTLADDLYVSGRLERISTPGVGGGGGLEWHHAVSPRRRLKLGLSAFALPGTRWGSGAAGATLIFGPTVVAAEASVGHSSVEGSFVHVYTGVARPLHGPRLAGDLECHYVGGHVSRGALAKAGLTFVPRPSLTVQVGYFRSFTGSLGSRLAVAKLVSSIGPRRYLVGGSLGRSSPSVLGFIPDQRAQSLRHVFGGVVFPLVAQGELLVLLEHYDFEVAKRSLISLTWKVGRR